MKKPFYTIMSVDNEYVGTAMWQGSPQKFVLRILPNKNADLEETLIFKEEVGEEEFLDVFKRVISEETGKSVADVQVEYFLHDPENALQ